MRQTSSRKLFEYWNRIRSNRPAPGREEIEPSDIRHLLADTFILEISRTYKTISYRLAGTRLCASFGRELKGYGFFGHWAESDCFDVARALAHVYQRCQPHLLCFEGVTENGRSVDFEMLVLPLAPVADGSARILGIATPEETPFWLGAEPLVECRLRSSREVSDANAVEYEVPSLALALTGIETNAEEVAAEAEALRARSQNIGGRQVAHLVVHDGGKR